MSCRQFSKSFSSLKYLLLIREKEREDSALPGPVKRKTVWKKDRCFQNFTLVSLGDRCQALIKLWGILDSLQCHTSVDIIVDCFSIIHATLFVFFVWTKQKKAKCETPVFTYLLILIRKLFFLNHFIIIVHTDKYLGFYFNIEWI